ncbi:MAG: hypothetical protein M3325_12210, partial [Actinomycetota bacterium]|nr:hypothetical protein [Actinomycetota bacterium]
MTQITTNRNDHWECLAQADSQRVHPRPRQVGGSAPQAKAEVMTWPAGAVEHGESLSRAPP